MKYLNYSLFLFVSQGLNQCIHAQRPPGNFDHPTRQPKTLTASGSDYGGSVEDFWDNDTFARRPRLSKFHLNFRSGDHEFNRFRILPYRDRVSIYYQDRIADNDYFHNIAAVELPPGARYGDFYGSFNKNNRGCIERTKSGSHTGFTPVLVGFNPRYANGIDNEADEIGVQLSEERGINGYLYLKACICFSDKNPTSTNDKYEYKVWYALVPNEYIYSSGGGRIRTTGGQFDQGGQDSVSITNVGGTRPVLVGFKFNYAGDDHDMDEIMVELTPGRARARFQDGNYDDDYSWKFDYALVKGM